MEKYFKECYLTIAIPVYNGEQTIANTLESIISELEYGVEILIVDNASTDNSCDIIHKFMKFTPAIRYHCNDVNVGAMKNYDCCVSRSSGRYTWLFGDDDKMTTGCVAKVLEVIRKNKFNLGFISISADIYGKEWVLTDKNPLGYLSDIYFNNMEEVFCTLKDHIGLTPTIIVRKDLWCNEVKIRTLTNDYWFHLRMILAICEVAPAYFIASPAIMFYEAEVRWVKNGLFIRIIIEYCELVTELDSNHVESQYKSAAISRWNKGLWGKILVAKNEGWVLNIRQLLRLVKIFKPFPIFWITSFPLLFIPQNVVKIIFYVRKIVKNH